MYSLILLKSGASFIFFIFSPSDRKSFFLLRFFGMKKGVMFR